MAQYKNLLESYMMVKTAILDFRLKNIFQYPMDVNNGNPIQTNCIKRGITFSFVSRLKFMKIVLSRGGHLEFRGTDRITFDHHYFVVSLVIKILIYLLMKF